jgi:hypothetical protein
MDGVVLDRRLPRQAHPSPRRRFLNLPDLLSWFASHGRHAEHQGSGHSFDGMYGRDIPDRLRISHHIDLVLGGPGATRAMDGERDRTQPRPQPADKATTGIEPVYTALQAAA